jgi:hypothetical protein
VEALLAAIDRAAFSATRVITLALSPDDAGRVRAQIASLGKVLEESTDDDGVITLRAELLVEDAARFAHLEPLPEEPKKRRSRGQFSFSPARGGKVVAKRPDEGRLSD